MTPTNPRDFVRELIALIDQRIKRSIQNYRPRAATLDGQIPPQTLPPGGNTGNGYTPAPHTHDDRYYTEQESDQRFAPIVHTHPYLSTDGGSISGDLHIGGSLNVFEDISTNAIQATTIAATVGLFVAPAGTPIGGVNVDGHLYGTNVSTTPTPHAIPKARADGSLDPGWGIGSGGGGTLPSAHASTHAAGGSDPISPASIGAATPADVAAAIAAAARPATIQIVTVGTGVSRTWSNMPAAVTEIFGSDHHRLFMELGTFTSARLQLRIGGGMASGSTLRAQYSTDNGTTWQYLNGSDGPKVDLAPATSGANIRAGAWATLSAGAKTGDVLIRLVGQDGDGVSDPNFGQVWLQLK